MSMHTTAKTLTMIALTCAVSACMAPVEDPVTVANDSQTIVTPWGRPSNAQANSTPQTMARPTGTTAGSVATQSDNLVMMEDQNQKMLDQMQKQQIDEARIALGILDRMAQRCVQQGDAASCATLQKNWAPLSQQLHKSLSMLSGDAMNIPMSDPTMSNMPGSNVGGQMAPQTTQTPQAPQGMAPSTGADTPEMEKVIPMTQPGTDG
ncbi:hypothetical protein [Thalassospira lohafexi]|uniref:Secreted protein n=1 Tax=Thalassospira lohafexi TaxID=744227 RepID=A0A2N3L3Y0_9PROT|nr:hypothetical protein [Thalassospira lohafexi]PKR57390.1 hypothetical protein COO92_15685 [Thalassospira lohafexi]